MRHGGLCLPRVWTACMRCVAAGGMSKATGHCGSLHCHLPPLLSYYKKCAQAGLTNLHPSCCSVSATSLQRFQALGGFARLTQLLQWAALSFSPEAPASSAATAATALLLPSPVMSSSTASRPGAAGRAAGVAAPADPVAEAAQHTQQFQQGEQLDWLMGVLWEWVAAGAGGQGGKGGQAKGGPAQNR